MIRRPPRSTRTDTLFPYTTLFRSPPDDAGRSAMTACFVYITASNAEEARRIGRSLVEARLAACANVHERITSIYWWEGAVQEGEEAVLVAKTRERSEELRVGKECVSTGRSRWAPGH